MTSRLTRLLVSIAIGLAAAGLWLLVLAPSPVQGAPSGQTFTPNSAADFPDDHPGDGVCQTGPNNHICTLRAAIMESNALSGTDTIQLLPNTTYQLSLLAPGSSALFGQMDLADSLGGDLDITTSVNILGAGAGSSIIDGNGAVIGDRVFQITGTVVISGVTIEHGAGQNVGGGLSNYFRLTVINSVIFSNTAVNINNWGGGMYNAGPLTITHSSFLSNTTGASNSYAGGLYNQGLLLITDSLFQGNVTTGSLGEGGGLFSVGYTATVVNSTFVNNTGQLGGGIYKSGYPLYVLNSTLSGNHSTGNGGGIYMASGATSPLVVINSTLSGNDSGGAGGGLFAAAGTTNLYNVTLTQNRANADNSGEGNGGGIAAAGGATLAFANSIVAHNTKLITMHPLPELENDDCAGSVTSQTNNLMLTIDPENCTVSGAYQTADPQLGPLANNGGPTLTHALLPGSPAIDAGNHSGCTDNLGAPLLTDQRGRARPGRCDIGAYEFPQLLYLPLLRR